MTIHADMQSPLAELTRLCVIVRTSVATPSDGERAWAALAKLEAIALRVAELEGGPVPRHWRAQQMPDVAPPMVVDLAAWRARPRQPEGPPLC